MLHALFARSESKMDLKELKTLWKEEGFRPNKNLGQNFLIDKNVRGNILKSLALEETRTVIEIGAGFGVMSFALSSMCERLIAVEKDERISRIMAPRFQGENITFIEGNALDIDICAFREKEAPLIVFGNIPYYISSPLIEKVIDQRECIRSVYLVMQEEFADRIVASAGSKNYGSISCFVQFYTKTKKLFKIKKNSFYPKPQVDSFLIEMKVLSEPSVKVKDKALMFKIVRRAFSQRRKKAVNPLSSGDSALTDKTGWIEVFEKCGIDPKSRAEALSLEDYAKISDCVGESFQP